MGVPDTDPVTLTVELTDGVGVTVPVVLPVPEVDGVAEVV